MMPKYFTIALFFLLISLVVFPVHALWCEDATWACADGSNEICADNGAAFDACGAGGPDPGSGCWYNPVPSSGPCAPVEPTPTSTTTPSANCVTKCGYTWAQGFTADDILLQMCVAISPLTACETCGWQMAAMEEQFPCEVPPSPVPTYDPTPIPTVPLPPTIPTIVPGPDSPPQIITIGDKDIHDVDFTVATIATIAIPEWNKISERNNITSVVGNITDPYLNGVDAFSVAVSLVIQHLMYLPNWVMATIYTTVQPIATAFAEIIVVVSEWGSVPLQLMRLALDNTPAGIQALLIYGVCLEMVIYLLRGET